MICPICYKSVATEKVERKFGSMYVTGAVCADCKNTAYLFNDRMFFEIFYIKPNKKCRTCGRSYGEISETLLVGCEDCYTVFENELKPLILYLQRLSNDY